MSTEIQRSISAMKTEENKLRQAIEKLQILEKQQKQFIGNISHEFKTPLTSIKAYSELIELYKDDTTLQDDAIQQIGLETNRLTDMVNKILRLAALEKYEFEYQAERVNVREILLDYSNRMKAKADRFGITILHHLTDAVIWGDREILGQIIINLLDNAIKYNVKDGQVTISNHTDGERVYIDIVDTGIGIPEESREKIFEPYYTVSKTRSRLTGGTGLGLSLVKELMVKHKGTIELRESEESKGTAFRLSFPTLKEQEH